MGNDLNSRIGTAIKSSARFGRPFALLECRFEVGSESGAGYGSGLDPEMAEIAVERLNQRLRSSDSVVLAPSGAIHVLAQALGDEQDAAGVAYRLLSSMVEPVASRGELCSVQLTIGVAVADGANQTAEVLAAVTRALDSALEQGVGGFSIVDLRPGLAA